MQRVVFICAPYRAKTPYHIEKNVRRAERLSLHLWRMGAAVVCPHTNSRYFQGAASDATWTRGYLEILRRCDALVLPGIVSITAGMEAELREARKHALPVFLWPEQRSEIAKWLAGAPTPRQSA
jgi:hypothetical protein